MSSHRLPCGCVSSWERTPSGYYVGFTRCEAHRIKLKTGERPTTHLLAEEIERLKGLLRRADPMEHCATGCDYCKAVSAEIDAVLKEIE